ncbi:PaaI family thioesterase [Cellvibrio sp. KY-YJ-3]|uniref:PaaI family thioesterase n=1 Tax=Cellvibrio sp. KY-YJ-3 TaxID=454662 RepID=UPI001244D93A|nr:PaaI family thioesterase [Cellvibrio sp. KY-YJ-3]QEY13702.1 PaaI family thioesterase [Cellvibrio sp. KY-YJ-3]
MEVQGHIKFTVIERSSEEVISEMPIQPGILNPFGTVNAGATLWLADVNASVLVLEGVNPEQGMKGFPLAININANLLGNNTAGAFVAKSNYVKKGRIVSVVKTTVTDTSGKLIAEVTTSHVQSA